jgi:hypothetical protein
MEDYKKMNKNQLWKYYRRLVPENKLIWRETNKKRLLTDIQRRLCWLIGNKRSYLIKFNFELYRFDKINDLKHSDKKLEINRLFEHKEPTKQEIYHYIEVNNLMSDDQYEYLIKVDDTLYYHSYQLNRINNIFYMAFHDFNLKELTKDNIDYNIHKFLGSDIDFDKAIKSI